jgi:hypothetical protein
MPSDWNSWYTSCGRCGSRYHASEGGCGCLDDHYECAGVGRYAECYVHCDEAIEWEGDHYCAEHLNCEGCGKPEDQGADLVLFEGDRYCTECMAEDPEYFEPAQASNG